MAREPTQSYIIWFSQRVGSTMLTQALEDTGIAGRPREWLEAGNAPGLLAKYGVKDAFELRQLLWEKAATPSGVMGTKYGMTDGLHREVTALFSTLIPGEPDPDGRRAWSAVYPRCRHVFLTRRNKLRLAVSWWRAIRANEWHRPTRPETVLQEGPWIPPPRVPAAELIDQYDREAIASLLLGANQREADMQELFDRWGVVPHTVVYEDLIASYEPTIRTLLDYLQIPGRETITIPAPAFERLADQVSEAWYQRFRESRAG